MLGAHDLHVLFAPGASVEMAALVTDLPICYCSDTSVGQLYGYYPGSQGYSPLSLVESHAIEQMAISRSAAQVYPSDYAAGFAERRYGARNVRNARIGANLEADPLPEHLEWTSDVPLRVLFVGLDWERKGRGDCRQNPGQARGRWGIRGANGDRVPTARSTALDAGVPLPRQKRLRRSRRLPQSLSGKSPLLPADAGRMLWHRVFVKLRPLDFLLSPPTRAGSARLWYQARVTCCR